MPTRPITILLLLAALFAARSPARAADPLDPALFVDPPSEYRPIDRWWWDGGYLSEEKLRWQLEDLHAKGVGGTWLYPRFGATQSMSAEPGYFTEGWWKYVDFALAEHERLGMTQWANDWLGRLDKAHFQNELKKLGETNPALVGRRLVARRQASTKAQPITLEFPAEARILSAAAYRLAPGKTDEVDGSSRVDISGMVANQKLTWNAPEAGWLAIAVASEPFNLDYLGPEVARQWLQLYFEEFARHVGPRLGKALAAYGPDERFVLSGNILYSDELGQDFEKAGGGEKGADLAALFIDVGPKTDHWRCAYYDAMVSLLEKNFYEPIPRWLHDHGMRHATVATWGREDLLGQVSNYGDFFRMMRHFDIPGNEDSTDNQPGAFIDAKLSASIAHLNGNPRVVACVYWGMGWGFTQEQNFARTNLNFAEGVNLINTHGGLYSLMGGRNEFVPPEVHFYQPYWQTWRTYSDYVTRLSYVLSQGDHRADVAILYPLSTLHAHWHDGNKFDPPAREAQQTAFGIARALGDRDIDFDFVDEAAIAKGTVEQGKLKIGRLEFSVVALPKLTTLRTDVLEKLQALVESGGWVCIYGGPPMASAEQGRDDPRFAAVWSKLFSQYGGDGGVRKNVGGITMAIRTPQPDDVVQACEGAIKRISPDVHASVGGVMHLHKQVGADHVYFIFNKEPTRRDITVTLRQRGWPEVWDAATGRVAPLARFRFIEPGTELRLDMQPSTGVLIVLRDKGSQPQVLEDKLTTINSIKPQGAGFDIAGTAKGAGEVSAQLMAGSRKFAGRAAAPALIAPLKLDGLWDGEYRPTMDNRWGDFRYPAAKEMIGPETPKMRYEREPAGGAPADWRAKEFDDHEWPLVQATFGPYWNTLGPIAEKADTRELRAGLIAGAENQTNVDVGGEKLNWQPMVHSWKFGAERFEVHQDQMDGIGAVPAEFLTFDPSRSGGSNIYYASTRVYAASPREIYFHYGAAADDTTRSAWINGEEVVSVDRREQRPIAKVALKQGWNEVVLRIAAGPTPRQRASRYKPPQKPSATYALFLATEEPPTRPRFMPLSPWHDVATDLVYDSRPVKEDSVGWFRFHAPPGATKAKLPLVADAVEAWVDGAPAKIEGGELLLPESVVAAGQSAAIALRVREKRGSYAGAAFTAPVSYDCGPGKIPLGDWSQYGLAYYSGGLTYVHSARVTEEQLKRQVLLDLGDARVSAEVTVNGRPLGARLAHPFVFDMTDVLRPGDNEIRVQVLNTLANYMSATPTRYVFPGQTVSGLLGPVELRFVPRVVVHCEPE